ncbi:MAG: response regulator [Thermodesulfobacteriota bacterium]
MSKRVLVIDDDEAVRKSFVLSLEDVDCVVDTAESGEKGIEMEREGLYDLTYLDLKMPGLNGVETLRELRKLSKDMPIYIVTAFHKEFLNQLNAASKDGLEFEIMKKPIPPEQLESVTRSILDGSVESY